jgi:hypothetical protein
MSYHAKLRSEVTSSISALMAARKPLVANATTVRSPRRRRNAKPAVEHVVSPAMQQITLAELPVGASTTPSPVMLPDDSVEREVVLRSLAERVARYHGQTTARFLASLLDEAADDAEEAPP